jgi:hypothetical protein
MNTAFNNQLPKSISETRKCLRWLAGELYAQLSPAWSIDQQSTAHLHRIANTNYTTQNSPLAVIAQLKTIIEKLEDVGIPLPRDTFVDEINAVDTIVRLLRIQ